MVRRTFAIGAWASTRAPSRPRSEAIWGCRPGRFTMWPVEGQLRSKNSLSLIGQETYSNGTRCLRGEQLLPKRTLEGRGGDYRKWARRNAWRGAQRPVQGLVTRSGGQPRGGSRNTKNKDLTPEARGSRGLRRASILSDYAVESRYPGLAEPVTEREYKEAVDIAKEVVRWAEGIMEGRGKA